MNRTIAKQDKESSQMTQLARMFAFALAALCSLLPQPICAQSSPPSERIATANRHAPAGEDGALTELKLIRLELLFQRLEFSDQRIADLTRELDGVSPKESD